MQVQSFRPAEALVDGNASESDPTVDDPMTLDESSSVLEITNHDHDRDTSNEEIVESDTGSAEPDGLEKCCLRPMPDVDDADLSKGIKSVIKFKWKSKKSVCDHLVEKDSSAVGRAMRFIRHKKISSAVGRATWFISHAWKFEFLDVVDAVKHHFHELNTADVIVWFDLFSNSQHNTADKPFTWWTGTFTNAISELGSFLMILHPWNDPITLQRAWCIFELYACTNTKSNFAIALPPRHTPAFRTSLRDEPEAFYKMLATIKSENSVAFKASDRDTIHEAIRKTVGFSALDRMVLSVLFNWMVSTLRSHILLTEKAGNEVEHGEWLFSLATLFLNQGRYEDAEPLFVRCQEIRRRVLGEDHPDMLSSINNLAVLYDNQGKYDKAEPLYVDFLERTRRVFGEDDPHTLLSINNLAAFYGEQGKSEKAEPLFVDCLERRRRVLGEDHPETLLSISNLAFLYNEQGKYEKAEPMHVDCLERRRRVLGEDHPATLNTISKLASLYNKQGKYEKAEPLYVDCLERRRLGKYEEAEPLYVDCLERRRRVLGEDHRDTLLSINSLAFLYDKQGKYEEAEALCVDCLERRRRVLGEDHPDTQTSRENLALFWEQKDSRNERYAQVVLGFKIRNLLLTQFQT
ncbi:Kinesin light chain 3 [Borealophlyctis nickersoniae]|nr:Kinesin light chain 3 [Borealophlyctis nickersoniae]